MVRSVIEGQERIETTHTHRERQREDDMFRDGGREFERGCAVNKRPHTISADSDVCVCVCVCVQTTTT